MAKEKQNEEMARIIYGMQFSDMHRAVVLYNAGYRKEDDIVKEIFEKLYANIKFDGHTVSIWKNDLIEAVKEYGISLE